MSLTERSSRWHGLLLGGVVFLLAAIAYANSFPGAFIVDDVLIVERNPLVHSFDPGTIFTSDYWGAGEDRGVYRPITILSFVLNRMLIGEEAWSYRLVNVLLHAWVGLAFFQLLRCWNLGSAASFCAAALFAVHPIHTEVVNEAVGRSELLAALFFLLALRLVQSEKIHHYWLAGLFYLLALLSKEHAITFLAAVFLVDVFHRRRFKERLPLYGGLLALTLLWLLFHRFGVDRGTLGRAPFYAIYSPLAFMPDGWRILTAFKLQLLYISKLFWPIGLQGVYSGPEIDLPVKSMFSLWGGVIVSSLFAAVALVVCGWRKRQPYALAILLYAGCFSVTSNLFFPIEVAFAERFAYLPSLWFCLGFTSAFAALLRCCPGRMFLPIIFGAVVLGGGLVGVTWARNHDYQNGVALFKVDFEKNNRNVLAGMFLGDAYVERGEYGRAEEVYQKILAFRSDLGAILEDMAWVQLRQNRPREALKYALRVVALEKADLSEKVLLTLAESYSMLGQPEEVIGLLEMIAPGRYPPGFFWELQGKAYEQLGDAVNAVKCYYKVGEPPLTSEVPFRLERLLRRLGEDGEDEKIRYWIVDRERIRAGKGR